MYISYLLYSKHSEVFNGLSSSVHTAAGIDWYSWGHLSNEIQSFNLLSQGLFSKRPKKNIISQCLPVLYFKPVISSLSSPYNSRWQNNFTYNFPNVTLCLMLSYPAQVVFTLIWTSQCQLYILHPITSAYPSNHISVFNLALITAISFHQYRTLIS